MTKECEMPTPAAMAALRRKIQDDPDYAQGWHDGLARVAADEGVDSRVAQRIASRLMNDLFDVDTRQR